MFFHLTELSSEPMHRQIGRQLRSRILTGTLKEGEPLPPLRAFARQQRVSAVSVERAYRGLIGEGLVETVSEDEFAVAALSEAHRQELARQRLFETLREQEFSIRELELARDIQCRLLPPPRIVDQGFAITCRNEPARFVTGDFYDVIQHSDGRLGLVVADVAGKGLGASLIMASVKAILPFLTVGRSADEALEELNQRLRGELRRREFVALAYALYDPATGELELANAGMPDPYLLRPNQAMEPLEVTGNRLPLGLREGTTYRLLKTRLEPGDRVLWISDGLPECPTPNGEPLGYRRFGEILRSTFGGTSSTPEDSLLDELFDGVRRTCSCDLPSDDWTALLLECRLRT